MPDVVITAHYSASQQQVWKAMTDAAEMKAWYFDLPDFRATPGFRFSFYGEGTTGRRYLHRCEVLHADAPHSLAYSWCYDDIEGRSTVRFDLQETANGTRLTLTHSGIDTFPADEPDIKAANFEKGWTELLQQALAQHLKG